MLAELTPHAAALGKWVLGQVGGLGGMLVQFVLMVLIAAVMFAQGEAGAKLLKRLGYRLAGERGEESVILAAQAVRGVALGVGVTAIVQTVLGGVGLAAAGIPMAAFLSAVMLMLCIALFADAAANGFDPFLLRDNAVEGNDQQAALHPAIHSAREDGERVCGEDMLGHRPEFHA